MDRKCVSGMDLKKNEKTAKEYGITLGNIWFSSKDHGENFLKLVEKFKAYTNPEFASACYIVFHPEIYYRINWDRSDGPIGWYWGEWTGVDDDDENGKHLESEIVGQLSSSYRGLVRAAAELYTGSQHYFDLMGWLGNAGDEVYKLFIQALEIRRDRFVVEQA